VTLIDRLADIEHRQWISWAKKLIETEPNLSPERVARWQKLFCDYKDLSEEWKEYDREWARRILRECRLQLEEDSNAYYFGDD
jgi:glutathione S-transferase